MAPMAAVTGRRLRIRRWAILALLLSAISVGGCRAVCLGSGEELRDATAKLREQVKIGSDIADLAGTAAAFGREFDLQVMDCGAEQPLRVQGTTSNLFAHRGGFSPMEDKPGAVERDARYSTPDELRHGLRNDLAKGLRCRRAFIGLHTFCYAHGFAIVLDSAGSVESVDSVKVWK